MKHTWKPHSKIIRKRQGRLYNKTNNLRAGSGWFHPDPARKLSTNLYDIYHCWVYSEWTHDGQRHGPKHVEFHVKNKFAKLVHLVGLIIKKFVTLHGHMNVKFAKADVLQSAVFGRVSVQLRFMHLHRTTQYRKENGYTSKPLSEVRTRDSCVRASRGGCGVRPPKTVNVMGLCLMLA
jgi:hypothetical protein